MAAWLATAHGLKAAGQQVNVNSHSVSRFLTTQPRSNRYLISAACSRIHARYWHLLNPPRTSPSSRSTSIAVSKDVVRLLRRARNPTQHPPPRRRPPIRRRSGLPGPDQATIRKTLHPHHQHQPALPPGRTARHPPRNRARPRESPDPSRGDRQRLQGCRRRPEENRAVARLGGT